MCVLCKKFSEQGCAKHEAVWRETRQRFTRHAHATYADLSITNAAFLTPDGRSGNAAKRLCPSTYTRAAWGGGGIAKRLCPSTYKRLCPSTHRKNMRAASRGGGIGDAREEEPAGTLRRGGGGDKRRSWGDGPRPQACLLPACAASLGAGETGFDRKLACCPPAPPPFTLTTC